MNRHKNLKPMYKYRKETEIRENLNKIHMLYLSYAHAETKTLLKFEETEAYNIPGQR